ncbi:MAG: penicillin-binding protein [Firmicutes bacterium]|nr:penicillin-binding protein [Bacillota bacterium]
MRKMERRAIICILLAMLLVVGMGLFTYRLAVNGSDWASFYANKHVYNDGKLAVGAVYDRNDLLLLENTSEGPIYNDDWGIRNSTLHVVGDSGQNISTAATYAFRSQILGYNFVTGTHGSIFGKGRDLKITIDARVSEKAFEALGNRNGFVGVYNWRTGEIICMVSNPGYDPMYPAPENPESGSFINKVISTSATPGSIFKLVTAAAALDEIEGIQDWHFQCTGSYDIEGEKITCPSVHGQQDFADALANSCNCAFASLTVEMGTDVMEDAVKKFGLTKSYDINGIKTQAGSFNFDTYNINLGWAGIGQFEDQVNPISMMVYVGAIAGGGEAAKPYILMDDDAGKVNLIDAGIAMQLDDMMRNNVISTYGDGNYPGLELRAKSGTAEGGDGRTPTAWFCGYSGDYAFIVCVENGGYGAAVAGPIANSVLHTLR